MYKFHAHSIANRPTSVQVLSQTPTQSRVPPSPRDTASTSLERRQILAPTALYQPFRCVTRAPTLLFFDTLQHHLDTRFAQLNTSVELEFWEAFQSIEDVHNLLTMAKKAPRWPSTRQRFGSTCWPARGRNC